MIGVIEIFLNKLNYINDTFKKIVYKDGPLSILVIVNIKYRFSFNTR